jgi:aspartokinase
MTSSLRLGGFKVLKDVTLISLVSSEEAKDFPVQVCREIAEKRINIPYLSAINNHRSWGMHIMVETTCRRATFQLINQEPKSISTNISESAILSLFPHRSNPTVVGSLFEVFGREGIDMESYANSPSAVSVVVKKDLMKKAGNALLGAFSFSAYRTPEDWKLAQKGKEQLYKEVVASYQEKKSKVYGLEYQEGLEFLHVRLHGGQIGQLGVAMKELARLGLYLTFLAKNPCRDQGVEELFFCLPSSPNCPNPETINRIAPQAIVDTISPVARFSMNGPHFGDRYGIASELLCAFKKSNIDLLALNCSIASIIGVVPLNQIQPAIQTIQGCFEVPSITKKEV